MYIQLGKSNLITDPGQENSEFFIVSQVVDSQLGYEKPVVVKTKQQLDEWFGQDYIDYNYMSDLIEAGVCLYICKPIQTISPSYAEESTTFYSNDLVESIEVHQKGIILKNLPKVGEPNFIYKIIDPSGNYSFKTSDGEIINYFRKVYSKEFNVYGEPEDTTISSENRDTLVIFNEDCFIKYCTPSHKVNPLNTNYHYIYKNGKWVFTVNQGNVLYKGKNLEDLAGIKDLETDGTKIKLDNLHLELTESDIENIENETRTLSFKLNFTEVVQDSYISLINLFSNKSILIYYSQETKTPYEIFGSHKLDKFFAETRKVTNVFEFKEAIESVGYYIEDNNIYAFSTVPVTYFSNIPSYSPDFQKTQDLIYLGFKDKVAMKFYSRTLGTGGIYGNIGVTLEKSIDKNSILVTVDRFGYSTTYEYEKETIDHSINRESSLIYCDLYDVNFHIPNKRVEMRGAVEERQTTEMYNNSMKLLFNSANVYPDYYLIPNIHKYGNPNDNLYETILNYAKYINCQVLIENTWENYKQNYLKDFENRLIYFLGDMTIGSNKKPGYFLYLSGLLGNVYSISSTNIIYKSPTNPFEEDIYDPNYKVNIDKYKSNYLTYNDNKYYYNYYLNGETYNTTGWMRFAISKITREIEKNKWDLLGEKNNAGTVENRFISMFSDLVNTFRIIDSITIKQFNLDQARNRLDLTIQTTVNDLVKNNITLDLTVNYTNKYN